MAHIYSIFASKLLKVLKTSRVILQVVIDEQITEMLQNINLKNKCNCVLFMYISLLCSHAGHCNRHGRIYGRGYF